MNKNRVALSKVASDLSISLDTIVKSLSEKGCKVHKHPNFEITAAMNILLQAEYKGIPEYSESLINLRRPNPEIETLMFGYYIEDKIDTLKYITLNAKSKFDYSLFKDKFDDSDVEKADDILFMILAGFATNKSMDFIKDKIISTIVDLDVKWEPNDIKQFLADKDVLLKNEIYMVKVAIMMGMEGYDSFRTLDTLKYLFSKETIDVINGVGSGRRTRKILSF